MVQQRTPSGERTQDALTRDRRAARWTLLGAGLLFAVLLVAWAALLELVFPMLALAAGVLLYRHYPVTYIGFTWWVVFLTPEIRRLVDYQSGWSDISPVMLAPWLVAGLAAFGVFSPSGGAWRERRLLPFWLALGAVAVGYMVGLLRASPVAATYSVLTWAVPILFGMHVVRVGRTRYATLRRCLKRTFLWGTLVMGSYGLVQFLVMPPWDAYWIEQSGMLTVGLPEPWKVRVFSTLNSQAPYSGVIMAGVLLLFVTRSRLWRLPAAIAGYTTLVLGRVRTAWLGWVIAAFVLVVQAGPRHRGKFVGLLVGLSLVASTAVITPPLDEVVGERLASLGDLADDTSMQERLAFLETIDDVVFNDPLGKGIGTAYAATKLSSGEATTFDNGLFNIPYSLGWVGALAYLSALALLLIRGFQATRGQRADAFAAVAFGIAVSLVAQLLSLNSLIKVYGMVFWTFAAVAVVAPARRTKAEAHPAERRQQKNIRPPSLPEGDSPLRP